MLLSFAYPPSRLFCGCSAEVGAASSPRTSELLVSRHQLVVLGRQAGPTAGRSGVPRRACSSASADTTHDNSERPHRALALLLLEPANAASTPIAYELARRDRLGGLIREYHRAVA